MIYDLNQVDCHRQEPAIWRCKTPALRTQHSAKLSGPTRLEHDRSSAGPWRGLSHPLILNGHTDISPKMAIRLEKADWSNAEFWLHRQATWDLAQARRNEDRIKVKRFLPHAAS